MVVKKLFFIVVLLWSTCAFAQHEHEYFTGEDVGVTWQDGIGAVPEGWEWQVQRVSDQFIILQNTTVEREVHFSITSAGLYVFYCRAWNYNTNTGEQQFSGWASSLTHGLVDGFVRAWQIKIKLKPVGPLMFDMEGRP